MVQCPRTACMAKQYPMVDYHQKRALPKFIIIIIEGMTELYIVQIGQTSYDLRVSYRIAIIKLIITDIIIIVVCTVHVMHHLRAERAATKDETCSLLVLTPAAAVLTELITIDKLLIMSAFPRPCSHVTSSTILAEGR